MTRKSPSLRWRMAFWLFTLMSAASIALSLYYHFRIGSLLEREADARIATLARHLAVTSVLGVLAGSEQLLAGTLDSANVEADVLGVAVFDAEGTAIAASVVAPAWSEIDTSCAPCATGPNSLRWVEPVTRQVSADEEDFDFLDAVTETKEEPRIAGWVVLEVSTTRRQDERRALLVRGVLIALAVLLAGLILTLVLSTNLTKHLRALTAAMGKLGRGSWNVPLSDDYPGEVQELAHAFRDMAAALAELDAENIRYREELEERVRQRTAELQAAYDEMKELNAEKDRFVSTVSHDFRSPLAIVLSCVQTVLTDEQMPTAVRTRFLLKAERQCHRLQALVSDLLDLARIENRNAILASTSLDDVAADSVDAQSGRFAEHGVTLTYCGPDQPVVTRVDRTLIERALGNLLDNALKFTPDQGRVTVGLTCDGVEARLSVADTGVGIAADEQPRLFERFFQGENGCNRGDGSGLGLAIVAEVARKHGGRVDVQSDIGAGTTFEMTLPLQKEREDDDHPRS